MKQLCKSNITYVKLLFAAFIFSVSLLTFDIASSSSPDPCFICNGSCEQTTLEGEGNTGCGTISGECFYFGEDCNCIDPTAPCEA